MKKHIRTFALLLISLTLSPAIKAQDETLQTRQKELIQQLEDQTYSIEVLNNDSVLLFKGILSSLKPRIRDGQFDFYYPSGKLYASGAYRNDVPVNNWTYYDQNGQLFQTVNYGSNQSNSEEPPILPNEEQSAKKPGKKKNLEGEEEGRLVDASPAFKNDTKGWAFRAYCDSAMLVPAFVALMEEAQYATVQFLVDDQGKIRHPKFKGTITPDLQAEILRVLTQMPDWQPAIHNKKPVSTRMQYTFMFETGFPELAADLSGQTEKEEIVSKAPVDGEILTEEVELNGRMEKFIIVEQMPTFNNGDPSEEFRKYIVYNLRYPEKAAAFGISGRVIVQFTVYPDGKVRDATTVASVDPLLDAEALRVVNSSPVWEPGRQRDKKVAVLFTFPISFSQMNTDPPEKLIIID